MRCGTFLWLNRLKTSLEQAAGRISPRWMKTDLSDEPFYAVLGCHSSGSSALAGVLCHLGVFMGDDLVGFYGSAPYYGGESRQLAILLENDLPEPCLRHRWPPEKRRDALDDFIRRQCRFAKNKQTVAGAKFPQLATWYPELLELLGDRLHLILCDRPTEESILSLQKRLPEELPEAVAAHQRLIADCAERLAAELPPEKVLRVSFSELLDATRPTVDRIAAFVRPEADESQRLAAVRHVHPEMRHIGT